MTPTTKFRGRNIAGVSLLALGLLVAFSGAGAAAGGDDKKDQTTIVQACVQKDVEAKNNKQDCRIKVDVRDGSAVAIVQLCLQKDIEAKNNQQKCRIVAKVWGGAALAILQACVQKDIEAKNNKQDCRIIVKFKHDNSGPGNHKDHDKDKDKDKDHDKKGKKHHKLVVAQLCVQKDIEAKNNTQKCRVVVRR